MTTGADPLDLAGQAGAKAMTALEERLQRERDDNDFRWLMAQKQGRRIVWRMLQEAGVFGVSFVPDPYTTAFREGNRNQGLALLARIHRLCPEQYTVMLNEQKTNKDAHARPERKRG